MKNLNLVELNAQELRETNGGFWWAVVGGLIISACDNFGDIRRGINDGYHGTPNP
ncbi:class IIb bacteriocin, lactobin A/cerein 7B family [Flavobacterium columnare]|uniref:Class IIb bacteriocin, lactobin A/cerein 7B family n=1 Tax=Flavobacterium columnare TaxID=996 RepID=A0A437UBF5_9FLAO|nr:class IIb bacteriocin, lactobin A/cerein 7B family [Flavobacterium columnare]RVU90937.1 class IIb bacteriocin, lactobin A/cerein 7B family [Flavobacterium columnare]